MRLVLSKNQPVTSGQHAADPAGRKIVLRILDPTSATLGIEALG